MHLSCLGACVIHVPCPGKLCRTHHHIDADLILASLLLSCFCRRRVVSYGGCAPDSNSCVTKPPEAPKPKPARKK